MKIFLILISKYNYIPLILRRCNSLTFVWLQSHGPWTHNIFCTKRVRLAVSL
jgi:hypothetical protein